MLEKLAEIETRFIEVREQLADPNVVVDMQRVKTLSKEFKELNQIVSVYHQYKRVTDVIQDSKGILEQESDEELRELAKLELAELTPEEERLAEELTSLLIPKDPEDSKNCILEIRAGTGGDEASLFAGDLFKMYQRFAERKGMKFELTDFHDGTAGGFKEVMAHISGEDCYGIFKFESGVHRVQRVPNTETQGRIHTSAATVAVLPEAEEFDVQINENDIEKETFCSSGAGGQSVNTTYSAVRLTHRPTGVVVSMQNERSQIKNYELAMKVLKTRIYDLELSRRNSETAALRRSLVSSGDRSAKIRTYNYPQSRVTDHRINFTSHNLTAIMNGDLDDMVEALRVEENANRLNGKQ